MERRSRSNDFHASKSFHVMAFFSCLAWLYIAGRLWQDAENRTLLANIFKRNSQQRPRVLSTEEKLIILGCRDLEKRIVEADMDLTLSKSQGFFVNYLRTQNVPTTEKFLAVIGVYTGFGSRLKRSIFRSSWMPKGDALRKLQEEKRVIIRFVIGRSANRGDSLDRNIEEEDKFTKDFLILDGHEEEKEETPNKVKFFMSTAVENWNADFYAKVDDNINLNLDELIQFLQNRRVREGDYMGCMKSGDVVAEQGKEWYEPEWWKFGNEKTYMRHAASPLIIFSKNLAQYIHVNSGSLKSYAHEDISIGSWMMGVDALFSDDDRLCCATAYTQDMM